MGIIRNGKIALPAQRVIIIGEVALSILDSIVVQACRFHNVAVGDRITAANVVVREGARRARFNASEGV
jgi:hypothetical protein